MGGTQCCRMDSLHREYSYSFITQKPLFNQNYQLCEWPENDPIIMDWMAKNKNWELSDKKPMKHNFDEKYFLGNWNEGTPEGRGIIYCPGEYFLEGNFVKGMLNGYCKARIFKNQCQFEGNLIDGKADGIGIFLDKLNKTKFDGMWRNSQPLNGTLLFTDDPYYEIIEIENYKEGRATIYFKNNQKFTGIVQPFTMSPNGQGTITFPFCSDKFEFKGEFRNGKMHGIGNLLWKDKSEYSGNYINGQKFGYGEYKFPSDKKYKGYWVNGKQQGPGYVQLQNGDIQKKGIWKQGSFAKKLDGEEYDKLILEFEQITKQAKEKAEKDNIPTPGASLASLSSMNNFSSGKMSLSKKSDIKIHEKTSSSHTQRMEQNDQVSQVTKVVQTQSQAVQKKVESGISQGLNLSHKSEIRSSSRFNDLA